MVKRALPAYHQYRGGYAVDRAGSPVGHPPFVEGTGPGWTSRCAKSVGEVFVLNVDGFFP
jgi:hypothetical protein